MKPPAPLRRLQSLLIDNPALGILMLSRFSATLAFQIQSVAVGWQIYDLTHDPVKLGYVGLAQFLPMMALTLIAGDVADRRDRRTILVTSSLVMALSAGLFLTLTLAHVETIWPFYLILILFGCARAFSAPAQASLLPLLVERERFAEAVGWSSSTFQIAVIIGPALGGFLYIAGPAATYTACLFFFLLTGLALARLSIPRRQSREDGPRTTMLSRVGEGIAFVRQQPIVLGAISLDLFAVLLGGATALLPAFAQDILHAGPSAFGLLRSAPAMGATLTAFALGLYPLRRFAGLSMFGCVALFGIATIAFGLSTSILLSFAALFVLGASDMISVYVRSTLIQLTTPDEMRGRVSAVNSLFIGASNELGEFESGVTAGWWGIVPAVIVGGFGTLAVVALWMWWFPDLRKADRLDDLREAETLKAAPASSG